MITLGNSEGKSYKHKIFENHRMCIQKLDLEIFKRKIEESECELFRININAFKLVVYTHCSKNSKRIIEFVVEPLSPIDLTHIILNYIYFNKIEINNYSVLLKNNLKHP